MGLGVLLVLVFLVAFSFTRAGVYTRTHTRVKAATSSTLNFQARLLNASGSIVSDGSYDVEFNLYSVSNGGTAQWTETQTVAVKSGYLSAYLGSTTPFPGAIDWSQEQWLTMNVEGDGEMTPRLKLTAVPYAFRAAQAAGITNGSGVLGADDILQKAPTSVQSLSSVLPGLRLNQTGSGGLLQLQGDGSDVLTVDKNGNLFIDGMARIGTVSGLEQLTVAGAINLGNTSNSNAGTLRWTGTDFEGFDGISWLSLTDDYTGTPTININKTANESVTASTTLQADDQLLFGVEANETWTFRFLIQASSPTAADLQFSVTAPSGATCVIGASDTEGATSVANLGCGVSSGLIAGSGGNEVYEVVGTVVNGATAGNVVLNWAQFTSSGTTTVRAGSYVFASRIQGSLSGIEFMTGGNSFGALAELGTNDNFGLDIQTNGTTRIGIASSGEVTLNSEVEATNGLVVSGGDINLSGTESILNVGSNITGGGSLTLASGGLGDLVLDSASGVLEFSDATWRRVAAGTTTINLNDSSDTTLSVVNSDGAAVANLNIEGLVTATAFSGDGSELSSLSASAITTGTVDDARLSANIVRLDTNQTITARYTFSDGLILGTSTSTTAGALRWNGTNFQGYNGIQWINLGGGSGGGGGPTPAFTSLVKQTDETLNSDNTLQDDDELSFEMGANESWTFRFTVQASSPGAADLQFAVTAPSGATCDISVLDVEGAVAVSDLGCGVTSGLIAATATASTYEIVGSIRNGATAGDVKLQWAQFVSDSGSTTVLEGSYLNASIDGGGRIFLQDGNEFAETAILGTKDNFGLNFITNNVTALALDTNGDATFTGLTFLNGGANIGNAAGDSFSIYSSAVSLPNGLNFDSNTLVIDAASNTIGINNAVPGNRLSINTPAAADSAAQALIFTGGAANKGLVLQRNSGQSVNLFEVQNESGQVLSFINENGQFGLGRGSGLDGSLIFHNAVNNNTATLSSSAFSSTRTINLPDEDGTLCLQDSDSCGYIKLGESAAQVDGGVDDSISINKTGASGNILTLQKNGSGVFTIFNDGAVQMSSDSTAALEVRNAGGTMSYLTVNTSGAIVQVGSATGDSTGVLFVLDTKNTSGDPTGVNGASYYNSNNGKSRCYENDIWTDCNTTPVLGETTLGSAANSITVNISSSSEYLHCRLDVKSRTGAAAVYMRFNGDNGAAAYNWNAYGIIAASVTDWQDNSDSEMQLSGTATGTTPFSADVNITSFSDTNKAVDWTATGADAPGTNLNRFSGGGTWANSSSSVSSVTFFTSASNFNTGTHAWCEGRNVR